MSLLGHELSNHLLVNAIQSYSAGEFPFYYLTGTTQEADH